jgi:hypothetical protein
VQYRDRLEPSAGQGAKDASPLNVDLGYKSTPSAAVPAPMKPDASAAKPERELTEEGPADAEPDDTAVPPDGSTSAPEIPPQNPPPAQGAQTTDSKDD